MLKTGNQSGAADDPTRVSEKSRHTPGPWAIAGQRHIMADPSRDGRAIASIDPYEFDHETRMANLRLIAAAPELFTLAIDMLKPGATSASLIESGRDLLARLGHDMRGA